ncbi:hypothetical protein JIN85_19915 [Luteolibacter pohnpeiensis]|uniref:Uncharacterized protein n=1 Tax=Luteolibacter pohnpeiensis TaxID=454153 RepID=A0A934SGD2_9BACT|nr:hypothetical protein [Luteolibacter pohnpeiensis]MBK1884688.1 hypothetical protein [Luteolibacter pohnpeiensis]
MKNIPLYASFAFLLSCQAFNPYPKYPGEKNADLNNNLQYWKPSVIYPETGSPPSNETIAEGRIAAIDYFYRAYVNQIYSEGKWVSFTTGSALSVLSAFATLGNEVFTESELKVFGGISTVITGSRDQYQKELLFDQTLPVLIQTMNKSRHDILLNIRNLEKDSSVPLPRLLGEVEKYYEAGSLISAINVLSASGPTQEGINKTFSITESSPETYHGITHTNNPNTESEIVTIPDID